MKRSRSVLECINTLRHSVFSTREISAAAVISFSNAVQQLNVLEQAGSVIKIKRGIWSKPGAGHFSVLPWLVPGNQIYLSFTSALNLHGLLEQVPQVTTCASTVHSRTIRTSKGIYAIHRIAPDFFFGFGWYKTKGDFLIASPEKALLDCLYLSGRKGNRYAHFPEIVFPKGFDWNWVTKTAQSIRDPRLGKHVREAAEKLRKTPR